MCSRPTTQGHLPDNASFCQCVSAEAGQALGLGIKGDKTVFMSAERRHRGHGGDWSGLVGSENALDIVPSSQRVTDYTNA